MVLVPGSGGDQIEPRGLCLLNAKSFKCICTRDGAAEQKKKAKVGQWRGKRRWLWTEIKTGGKQRARGSVTDLDFYWNFLRKAGTKKQSKEVHAHKAKVQKGYFAKAPE